MNVGLSLLFGFPFPSVTRPRSVDDGGRRRAGAYPCGHYAPAPVRAETRLERNARLTRDMAVWGLTPSDYTPEQLRAMGYVELTF